MPYIDQGLRNELDGSINEIVDLIDGYLNQGQQAGMVNYVIAYLVSRLTEKRGYHYDVLNEFIGALECCKLELYRRLVVPYEDGAKERNGDVF